MSLQSDNADIGDTNELRKMVKKRHKQTKIIMSSWKFKQFFQHPNPGIATDKTKYRKMRNKIALENTPICLRELSVFV